MFTGRTPSASSGSFYRTTSPAEGDIGYQTNSRGSGHWFIIKAVNSDGTYTVIEQNWKWKSGGRTYCYRIAVYQIRQKDLKYSVGREDDRDLSMI